MILLFNLMPTVGNYIWFPSDYLNNININDPISTTSTDISYTVVGQTCYSVDTAVVNIKSLIQ